MSNSKTAKEISINDCIPVINTALTIIVTFLLFYGSYGSWDENIPGHKLPLFIAPIITDFIAFWTFCGDFLYKLYYAKSNDTENNGQKDAVILITDVICLVLVSFWCVLLTKLHPWWQHLFLMLALFITFGIWDCIFIKNTPDTENFHDEINHIIVSHKHVNRPSIYAIVLLLLFLTIDEYTETGYLFPSSWSIVNIDDKEIISLNKDNFNQYIEQTSTKDIFVSGVISFHLFVSAIAFFSASFFNNKPKEDKKIKRILWYLFSSLPEPLTIVQSASPTTDDTEDKDQNDIS